MPFFLSFVEPEAWGPLVPTTPNAARGLSTVLLEGRFVDPTRPDEIVIDEHMRDRHGLRVGSRMVIAQSVTSGALEQLAVGDVPEDVDLDFRVPLRVVGIQKSLGEDENATLSAGFYERFGARLIGPVNMFVALRGGEARFEQFRTDVTEIMGRPVAVDRGSDFTGLRKLRNIADVERNGLLLFAVVTLLGGGVLVGQALVRATTAGAGEVATWRAMGADRRLMVTGIALPAVVVAAVGVIVSIGVAIALSSRFPLGTMRSYELDLGVHADWPVLLGFAAALVVATVVTTVATAWWRTGRVVADVSRPSTVGDWAARVGLSPALVVGARLAVEPGRGRRAVPVRSALVGAIAGVLGVVACFTFRAGIDDALARPQRSGIVWDSYAVSLSGPLGPEAIDVVGSIPGAREVVDAVWVRSMDIDTTPTPVFGIREAKGSMPLVVLEGRAPSAADEIAFGPTTMRSLGLAVGDRVGVGADPARRARVVGAALLPETGHTSYDQGAWMTRDALDEVLAIEPAAGPEDVWGYALVRWEPGAQAAGEGALWEIVGEGGFVESAVLPGAVGELRELRALPLALAAFFGLLAVATVAHALVTTVRRRRHDLAVMRAFGFTGRQSRVAIAWQATLLAVAGVVVGVPLGIVAGRTVWRWLAQDFPVVYVPPVEVVVVLVVVPAAILVVNAIAVGPGRAAARIRPAEALRVE